MKLRLTKQFVFEMAHALPGYEGKCSGIHGHSYHLGVTVEGEPIEHDGDSADGMVMDFAELKRIVNETIIEPFDHALVLPDLGTGEPNLDPFKAKTILTRFRPTTENLLLHFASLIKQKLPTGVKLHSLCLSETDTSIAELVF